MSFERAVCGVSGSQEGRMIWSVPIRTIVPESHGFRDPDNRVALFRSVEEFFRRHLGVCH